MSGGFAIMFVSLVGMGLLWLYKKGREDGRKETAKEIMEPIIERD